MQCKPERLPKVFQKSLLILGNEGQVRLPCLETVLLKAINTGWGFLCDCGVHVGETDEPHNFGKGIKQLDWTCSHVWGFLGSRGPAAPVCSTACRFYSAGCPYLSEVLMETDHWDFSCCTSGNLYQTREKQCSLEFTYKFQCFQAFWHNPHTQSPKLASC